MDLLPRLCNQTALALQIVCTDTGLPVTVLTEIKIKRESRVEISVSGMEWNFNSSFQIRQHASGFSKKKIVAIISFSSNDELPLFPRHCFFRQPFFKLNAPSPQRYHYNLMHAFITFEFLRIFFHPIILPLTDIDVYLHRSLVNSVVHDLRSSVNGNLCTSATNKTLIDERRWRQFVTDGKCGESGEREGCRWLPGATRIACHLSVDLPGLGTSQVVAASSAAPLFLSAKISATLLRLDPCSIHPLEARDEN